MRVGTSGFIYADTDSIQDHPHACGDKRKKQVTANPCIGSSPCVWGQVDEQSGELESRGIIPMRVGTRYGKMAQSTNSRDHPHACGDKLKINLL